MTHRNWLPADYAQAYVFAAKAHGGQMMPASKLPYVTHISLVSMEVIAALRLEPGRDEALAIQCALLHDVVEDTDTSEAEVRAGFGIAVAAGVLALSKDKTVPKAQRLADSLCRIRKQPPEVWMVKLADRTTNLATASLLGGPPTHWTKDKIAAYRDEAVQILDALGSASMALSARLKSEIKAYKAFL